MDSQGKFETLIRLLAGAKLADVELLRDALWLARFVPIKQADELAQTNQAGEKEDALSPKTVGRRTPAPSKTEKGRDNASREGGRLYPMLPSNGGTSRSSPVYVPASGDLPQPLQLGRALRPYQQKLPSRTKFVLDEPATAELSAERGELTPVLKAQAERWFSLSLIVDDTQAMTVWRKTAKAFAHLLGDLGIFRDVRSWTVDSEPQLKAANGRRVNPLRLADPSGRTLTIVLTNGVGPHWNSRKLVEWLTQWAKSTPVAICSLLPPARWQHTDLGPAYLWARSPIPGISNRLLTAGEGPRTVTLKEGATVFPVFPMTQDGLAEWAAMQMARRETRVAALAMAPHWYPAHPSSFEEKTGAQPLPRRVAEFLSIASEDAARLLSYFSEIPLYLPIMRLVQHTMLPGSPLSAMAEVLMSGLVEPFKRSTPATSADPESTLFDFVDGAREYLRDRASIRDIYRINREVKDKLREYIERRAGISINGFEAWVADTDGIKELPDDAKYFAEVSLATLRALAHFRNPIPAAVATAAAVLTPPRSVRPGNEVRPLFIYWNPVDFGQPGDSGFGTSEPHVADQHISRYLELGEVKGYRRYKPLLDTVHQASLEGKLPTVLFCVGIAERQLRERLQALLKAGTAKLLVYVANNADSESIRRAVFEAGSLCCWDSKAFPEKEPLTLLCTTDHLPYRIWKTPNKIPWRGPVFVGCSYDSERRHRFEYWIRTGLTLSGLSAQFTDGHAVDPGTTIDQIKKCVLMIAILDEPYNPNVIYEIGLADALGIPTIIYKESRAAELPLDLRERVHDQFTNAEDLGYRLHYGLRNSVESTPSQEGPTV